MAAWGPPLTGGTYGESYGEEIVQTTNSFARSCAVEAAKAVVGTKIPRLVRAVPVQVRPPHCQRNFYLQCMNGCLPPIIFDETM